jgi:hypothetical protein
MVVSAAVRSAGMIGSKRARTIAMSSLSDASRAAHPELAEVRSDFDCRG